MVAQSIGARDHARVGQVTLIGVLTNLAMTGTMAALIVLFDRPLLALFLGGDSPAVPIAALLEGRLGAPGDAVGIVLSGGNVDLSVCPFLSGRSPGND